MDQSQRDMLWEDFLLSENNRGHADRELSQEQRDDYIKASVSSAQQTALRVKEHIAPYSPKRILDIGCSFGCKSYALAEAFPEADVIGVDLEWQALQLSQELKASFPRVQRPPIFIQGVGEALPLHTGSFDLIICHTVIEHVSSVTKVVSELQALISPSGYIHLEGPNYLWPYEPHIKIWGPPILGKSTMKFFATIQGKGEKNAFLDHLTFVTTPWITKLFTKKEFHVENLMQQKLLRFARSEEQSKRYGTLLSLLRTLQKIGIAEPLISIIATLGIAPSMQLLVRKKDDQ